jgi:3-oxoacyl-[acyl-carrier-protein] synthase II
MASVATDAIAVTGIGLATSAGIGVEDNWRRVCSGVSTASTDPELAGLAVDISCRVPEFDGGRALGRKLSWRLDRFAQLSVVAAREAVTASGLSPADWDTARIGVVMGNSFGGSQTYERQQVLFAEEDADSVSPMLIPMVLMNMAASCIAMDLAAHGPSMVTAGACASGTIALGTARELLRSRVCDVVIAGGSESCISRTVMAGLIQMGAVSRRTANPHAASRPFDVARDGFVIAEGAGVLVLERAADATARRAPIAALIAGYAASSDAYHLTAPDPTGRGFERALRGALADAGIGPDEVDHVNAHGTSTKLNDVAEGIVLRRVLGERPAVTSTKGVTGHPLAAAGAIEAAYTALAIGRSEVPPTANLSVLDSEIELDIVSGRARAMPVDVAVSTSLGFGGHNAVVVLTKASGGRT